MLSSVDLKAETSVRENVLAADSVPYHINE